jgi:hypothetical protein
MAAMSRAPRRPQELHIDQIALPPGTVGTQRVRAAIERELARLLAAEPAAEGAMLPGADVTVDAGAAPDAIGVAVARQIHARLTGGGDR